MIALDDNGETLFRKRVATPRGDYNATLNAIAGLVHDAEVATARKEVWELGSPGHYHL